MMIIKNNQALEIKIETDDLTSIDAVISALEVLDHAIVDSMDLNSEESEELMQATLNDAAFDIDVARRGLLSLSFSDWFDGLLYEPGSRDWQIRHGGFAKYYL